MSRPILFALLALWFAARLHAQPQSPPPGPPGSPAFAELADALQLSDEQRAPVKAIVDEQHVQMRALDQASREQRDELRSNTHEKLAALLNDTQMQRLQAFEESHRPRGRQEGRQGARRAPPPRD